MTTTEKYSCRMIARLLLAHGIDRAIMSPGSRNLPLLMAFSREKAMSCEMVVDERCAAFMALGMAATLRKPVALVCTSGTAMLNYAPAVAEAYYRHVPLIVVSADRPAEWIDQDDSQTIRQPGALGNFVKRCCDIPADCSSQSMQWYANRTVNDVLLDSVSGCPGPVHINVQLDAPLNRELSVGGREPLRVISSCVPQETFAADMLSRLAQEYSTARRVMVIAGFHQPDSLLNRSLEQLAGRRDTVVLTETLANLKSSKFISSIDTVVGAVIDRFEAYRPNLVITLGGALVSRFIKTAIRNNRPVAHWHVGLTHSTVDCLQSLTLKVEASATNFFAALNNELDNMPSLESDYAELWHNLAEQTAASAVEYVDNVPWSDLKAFDTIVSTVPDMSILHLSNGTPVRYAQLFADRINAVAQYCNRGVSGIDGSTSTAIGSSLVYEQGKTLLITGDMSAQYDIGALAFNRIPSRFRMIVMCNDGGAIFRFIQATSGVREREMFFAEPVNLPIAGLAEAFGFEYYEACDNDSLVRQLKQFWADSDRPALLAVKALPAEDSAEILKRYFKR